jgi:hypothetical protein
LSPAIGIEVRGIDLAQPLDESSFEPIRLAWERHGVLLIRGQDISQEQQALFAGRFGTLARPRLGPPPVLYVSNARSTFAKPTILPDGPVDFHSDQSYLAEPAIAATRFLPAGFVPMMRCPKISSAASPAVRPSTPMTKRQARAAAPRLCRKAGSTRCTPCFAYIRQPGGR